jgi:hypothetical protein
MPDDFPERTETTEPGPQPDPMLKTGRPNTMWVWLIGVVIAGAIVATLVALSPAPNTAALPDRPVATGSNTPPQSTMPASRDNSNAVTTPPATTGSGDNTKQ